MKAKFQEKNTESNLSAKEQNLPNESEKNKLMEQSEEASPDQISIPESYSKELYFENFNNDNGIGMEVSLFHDFKDGSSDSDSSAILNEDNSPNQTISSNGIFQNHQLIMSSASTSVSSPSASSMNCFPFQKSFQPYVKLEEHNFFSGEEACDFFSDEQAPSLPWYCSDQWT